MLDFRFRRNLMDQGISDPYLSGGRPLHIVVGCLWGNSKYVGDSAGFSKNIGTTIYGMTAQY
jgi:hypothetical protein